MRTRELDQSLRPCRSCDATVGAAFIAQIRLHRRRQVDRNRGAASASAILRTGSSKGDVVPTALPATVNRDSEDRGRFFPSIPVHSPETLMTCLTDFTGTPPIPGLASLGLPCREADADLWFAEAPPTWRWRRHSAGLPVAAGVPGDRHRARRTVGRLGRRDLRPRPDRGPQATSWPPPQLRDGQARQAFAVAGLVLC